MQPDRRRFPDRSWEAIMAWKSDLEHYPEHVREIGMISIENGNLELALADLLAATLMLPRSVAHAIYFTPRAASLRIDIFAAATKQYLKTVTTQKPNQHHRDPKARSLGAGDPIGKKQPRRHPTPTRHHS